MEQILQFLLPELGRRCRFIFVDNGVGYTLEHMSRPGIQGYLQKLRHLRRTTTLEAHPRLDAHLHDQEDADSLIQQWVVEDIPKAAEAIKAGRARLHKGVVFAHHVLRAQVRHRSHPLAPPEPSRCQPTVQYLNLNATLVQGFFYIERNQTRKLPSVSRTVLSKIQSIKDGEPDFITFKYLLRKEEFPRAFYDTLDILPSPEREIFPIHDRRAAWPAVMALQWKHKHMVKGHRELTSPQQPVVNIPYKQVAIHDLDLKRSTARCDILGLHVRRTPEVTETYQTGKRDTCAV